MARGIFVDARNQTIDEVQVDGYQQLQIYIGGSFDLLHSLVEAPVELLKSTTHDEIELIPFDLMIVIYVNEFGPSLPLNYGFFYPQGVKIYGNGVFVGIHDDFGRDTDIRISKEFLSRRILFWGDQQVE
jgi:hypothetical protein